MAAVNIPSTEREINGRKYRLTALAAGPGRRMMIRLMKVIGPGLAATLKAAGGGSLLQADTSVLADGVTELCKNLSEDEFDSICKIFLEKTEVQGEKGWTTIPEYDAFAADYGSLMLLLAAHIDHNYSSFFGVLKRTAP